MSHRNHSATLYFLALLFPPLHKHKRWASFFLDDEKSKLEISFTVDDHIICSLDKVVDGLRITS